MRNQLAKRRGVFHTGKSHGEWWFGARHAPEPSIAATGENALALRNPLGARLALRRRHVVPRPGAHG